MKTNLFGAVFAAVALGVAVPASADTIYSYTGSNFTDCSGGWTGCTAYNDFGSFTTSLSGAALDNLGDANTDVMVTLPVTSFSFSNGLGLTLTNANTNAPGDIVTFSVTTDANGNLTSWVVAMYQKIYDPNINGYEYSAYMEILDDDMGLQIIDDAYQCTSFDANYNCIGRNYADTDIGQEQGYPGQWTQRDADVPEPASLALLGSAIAGYAASRRRKAKSA